MRLLLVGVAVLLSLLIGSVIVSAPASGGVPHIVETLLVLVVMSGVLLGVAVMFSRSSWQRSSQAPSPAEEEMLNTVATTYRARRALEIEEWGDEGLHYFLELDDGSVLFLSGQYLYDYLAIEDDPEFHQPRLFPCTDFVVKRHRNESHVLEIVTGGAAFEPEAIAPTFSRQEWRSGSVPDNGDIIRDQSFDQIKSERMKNH